MAWLVAALVVCCVAARAEEMWATATGREDDRPIIYRFQDAPAEGVYLAEFPHRFMVMWRYRPDNDSGMPDKETFDRQGLLEDLLYPAFNEAEIGRLMLVSTGNGRKDWIWYVRDTDQAMKVVNRALHGQERFPIEIEWEEDPAWVLYWNFRSSVDSTNQSSRAAP